MGRLEGELGMRRYIKSHCKFTFINKLEYIDIPIYYERRIRKEITSMV